MCVTSARFTDDRTTAEVESVGTCKSQRIGKIALFSTIADCVLRVVRLTKDVYVPRLAGTVLISRAGHVFFLFFYFISKTGLSAYNLTRNVKFFVLTSERRRVPKFFCSRTGSAAGSILCLRCANHGRRACKFFARSEFKAFRCNQIICPVYI